ncbi:hypothetical protein BDV37DRAFT_269776 [Aspergillus pseudonomiae]|uniref:Amidohydrolase-related domain-containing protein n=1 Tax=Aspergillus pseudonomiae TaxID=1506151 RepID=A0A5N7DMM8_9EURO|nr:uncharacterized protein BDV37DRAFT_269776 [Aspergillus pseudonomiae]KAE8406748.1 hypothetical protein BDV37DRAFT_269776 [Aspergillus pseudonomiae]
MGALDAGISFIHGCNLGAISFLNWVSVYQKTYYKDSEDNYGGTEIIEILDLQGYLYYLGHFVHPIPAMLSEAGVAGVYISRNPLSNRRLGSGVADISEYPKHNLSIGLGVDGEASSDCCDLFENMRMGIYSIRGKYKDPQVLNPFDMLHIHTLGAAQTLGIADRVGSITVGKYADKILHEPPRALLGSDPVPILVLSAVVEHIQEVFVGGVSILPNPFASKVRREKAPRFL